MFRVTLLIFILSSCRANVSTSQLEQSDTTENSMTLGLEEGSEPNNDLDSGENTFKNPQPTGQLSPYIPATTNSPDDAVEDFVTIAFINNGNFNSYWKLVGTCSDDNTLVRVSYQTHSGGGATFVPCVEGTWIYNDMYGADAHTVQATHLSASATMSMASPTPWNGEEIDCDSEDPYTWRHEITSAFGQPECHAVAYCSSGRPYVYSQTISTQCEY